MSYEITGQVIHVGQTIEVTDKFRKRELVISKSESNNGQTYTEEIKFQTTQAKCGILDAISVGDDVDVKFNIKGKKWTGNGKVDWFTNLDAWDVKISGEGSGSGDGIPSANESILGEGDGTRVTPTEGETFFDSDKEEDELPF